MVIRGRVHHGVVVLEDGAVLPEGASVTVSCPTSARAEPAGQQRRIQLPLVPSEHPGSVPLTAERVAELLDDANASA